MNTKTNKKIYFHRFFIFIITQILQTILNDALLHRGGKIASVSQQHSCFCAGSYNKWWHSKQSLSEKVNHYIHIRTNWTFICPSKWFMSFVLLFHTLCILYVSVHKFAYIQKSKRVDILFLKSLNIKSLNNLSFNTWNIPRSELRKASVTLHCFFFVWKTSF